MKKTLLISNEHPLPEDHGSSIRTMNFVRFFKKYGIVDLAYSYKSNSNQVKNHTFSNEFFLEDKGASESFKRRFISGLIKGIPMPVRDFGKASRRFLLDTINEKDYDYIIVRYVINASLIFNVATKYKMRTIIDFDDILTDSLYESRFGPVKGWFKKSLHRLNKKSLRNYEKKCLVFGISLFCSEKDRATMVKEHESSKTFVVPNIYDNRSFERYDFGNGFKNKNVLLFVGTLSYKPNIDGLKWFLESVFPDFKKKFVDARLIVVGRCPNEDIKALCNNREDIEMHSDVPDVKKYYIQCRALIVPILSASGTRIKILEAALTNTPVLSTPKGAEGLDLADETELLLFDNAEEFSTKYNMLNNEENYHSLINNAKEAVSNKYSLKKFNNEMEEVLSRLESP